jgi:outer membrane protein
MKTILLLFLAVFGCVHVNGQTVKRWTIQECIDHAWKNNLQLSQNELQVQQAEVNLLQSKAQALPTLNGSANHTYNTGRRIDPFTNQFADQRVLSQNFSVSSGINVFNGLTNLRSIQANQAGVKAAKFSNDQLKNDIALQVTNAFLNALLAQELMVIAESQYELAKQQTERAKLLFDAGRTAKGDFLQVEANESNEALNVVNAKNREGLALLTLAQLLQLEEPETFSILAPNFSQEKPQLPPYQAKALYTVAVENQPGIQSADWNVQTAELTLKSLKGGYLPSLSAFGGLGTGYSELSRKIVGTTTQQQNFGSIGGVPIIVDVDVPITELTPFNEQLDQNFNRTFGLSLNVPIFNNLRTRSQVSLQKINLESARINAQVQRNLLRRDIQSAWFDARAAYERFQAAEKSLNATQEAFGYMQQRFDAGVISIFEFNNSRNQLVTAKSSLAQARYELILRIKVLDFYQGKPITF